MPYVVFLCAQHGSMSFSGVNVDSM